MTEHHSAADEGVHFVADDGQRFPICGSWRSNWSHTGDPSRATCPACRVRLDATASSTPVESSIPATVASVSIVHVDTGLVTKRTYDTVTSDVPADMSEDALGASMDAAGHLRYLGTDGALHVCDATIRRLGDRASRERYLLPIRGAECDRAGWTPLEVCVLEPAPTLADRPT